MRGGSVLLVSYTQFKQSCVEQGCPSMLEEGNPV